MMEWMNGMTDGMRGRFMPRRNNGIGTMTAMLIGASVGIAAWEAWRRNQTSHGNGNVAQMAREVIGQMDD